MPTENEKKFVLDINCAEKILNLKKCKLLNVRQGYLMTSKGITLRFRDTFNVNKNKNSYYMTFKCNEGCRVIEIEKKIDKRDFDSMWKLCMNKVYKVRVVVEGWEIDLFKDHDGNDYFIMAEYEMPEGQKKPEKIPFFIAENLIFEVPLTDTRFSSKMISDARYAKDIYKTLTQKKKGNN